ncbi:HD domain-containing protein [Xanthomonas perforans]|uniref:Guanosine polyphosphate pyrophosphohydrolase n=3 Tax=Xanthomonas perforans TaxID=442694 RepID=A0A0G9BE44_XANPE|nr:MULTISPECIES: HD domain-containing protein [Xanthomonas]OHX23291.1 guanosine polyphosphate pyrophosphohydrolase [Xanthomonas alfalfae]APO99507.1 guanosine polyphosphate pyrophosphohydrolase [Xanthomonas perforans]AQS75994.1 guanosine polyphosphate pyrophosphohydrolase [Xanthomonas perforans 91-118]KLC05449.1 guanosine polyphosphate pyrophosphohydrolase [Xanthomonas perforans]KLC07204.1 guanosine polyphosphate pyrophosphohydrolase [Xanthomonas perforans]
MTALTERYALAVDYARIAHAGQVRKGTQVPYLSHLLGVSTLVLECGGDEEQAIAGLLHDVVEDCGGGHEASIRAQFGDAVADIVMACTDATAEDKAEVDNSERARKRDWRERKQAYLAHLRKTPERALLVSGCDKLYNARSIVQDLENPAVGQGIFDVFTAGREGTLWYYAALEEVFRTRNAATARLFSGVVTRMHALADTGEQVTPAHALG